MNQDILEYIILIITLMVLLLAYFGYVMYDEQQKINYYHQKLHYESAWDKYQTMIKMQRKVIFKKKVTLSFLKVLVFFKELVKWK